jgi:hypothetical protein
MKQRNYLLFGLLITLGVLASCQKNSSPNSSQSALGFQLQAINKTFPVGTVLDNTGNVTTTKDAVLSSAHNTGTFAFDTAVMNVSRIKFDAEEHKINSHRDSIEVTIEWSGPKTVDLFNMSDLIGQINLVHANYDQISVMMQSVRGDFGTSPVFYLAGTYTNDSAKVTPIRIIIDESISFSAEQSGAALDSTSNWVNLVQVNLSLVMSHVRQANLDAATLTNGVIVVSSTSNTALYRNIRFDFDRARYCRFMHWHR